MPTIWGTMTGTSPSEEFDRKRRAEAEASESARYNHDQADWQADWDEASAKGERFRQARLIYEKVAPPGVTRMLRRP